MAEGTIAEKKGSSGLRSLLPSFFANHPMLGRGGAKEPPASNMPAAPGPTGQVQQRSSLSNPPDWLLKALGISQYYNGKSYISDGQAWQVVAFYACIKRIAQDMAMLPLKVHKATQRGGKVYTEVVREHAAHALVYDAPNPYQTAYELRERLVAEALIYSHAYLHIVRAGGRPVELWVVPPSQVTKYEKVDGRGHYYQCQHQGRVEAEDMLVLRNFMGINVVGAFNQLLGLSLSAQDFANNFFNGGGTIQHVLKSPVALTEDQYKNIKASWTGGDGDTRILEYGLEHSKLNADATQSELTATRRRNMEEVCMIFGMHPALIGVATERLYDSPEALYNSYTKSILLPWCTQVEQLMNARLFFQSERATHFVKHNMNALLRGDTAARAGFYSQMLAKGVLSVDDVREMEDMNPIDGGEQHLVQVNQMPLGKMEEYANAVIAKGLISEKDNNNEGEKTN